MPWYKIDEMILPCLIPVFILNHPGLPNFNTICTIPVWDFAKQMINFSDFYPRLTLLRKAVNKIRKYTNFLHLIMRATQSNTFWYIRWLHEKSSLSNLQPPSMLLMIHHPHKSREVSLLRWSSSWPTSLPPVRIQITQNERLEVFITVRVLIVIIWVVTTCSHINSYQRLRWTYCLHLQGKCEDRRSMILNNVANYQHDYMESQPTRLQSKPEIWLSNIVIVYCMSMICTQSVCS
jgi:hypothetical protein